MMDEMRCTAPLAENDVLAAPRRAGWMIVAAVTLGFAIHVNNGVLHAVGILWLSASLAALCAAFVKLPAGARFLRFPPARLPELIAAGIFIQFILLLCCQEPGAWRSPVLGTTHFMLLAIGLGLCELMFFVPSLAGRIFPLVLVVFTGLGALAIHANAQPHIDVWRAQTAGLDAMRSGGDPWSSTIADLYHLPDLYSPGTVRDGVVHLGFPYPPLMVYADLPGYWLCGDYRYGYLAATVLAAIFIVGATPGRSGYLLAALFLFTPRAFHVLSQGWSEPVMVMLLAATVWCARKRPRALPLVLGLFLVSKQYAPLAVIPALLLARTWKARAVMFGKAALVGLLVSLPLALWNTPAFIHSTLGVAAGTKFRMDSLCFIAWIGNVAGWEVPAWAGSISYIAGVSAGIFAVRRSPRSPAGFSAAVSLAFLCFFAVNKFAFCNYYHFIIAALCIAAGAEAQTVPVTIRLPDSGELEYAAAA